MGEPPVKLRPDPWCRPTHPQFDFLKCLFMRSYKCVLMNLVILRPALGMTDQNKSRPWARPFPALP